MILPFVLGRLDWLVACWFFLKIYNTNVVGQSSFKPWLGANRRPLFQRSFRVSRVVDRSCNSLVACEWPFFELNLAAMHVQLFQWYFVINLLGFCIGAGSRQQSRQQWLIHTTVQATALDPGNGAWSRQRSRQRCLIQATVQTTMTNPGKALANERRNEGNVTDEGNFAAENWQLIQGLKKVESESLEGETREVYENSWHYT